MPAQSVAQNTKPCSWPIACTLPPPTSLALPRRPWPYSEGRWLPGGLVPSTARRGIVQITLARAVLPGVRRGLPSAPRLKPEPGGQPGESR